MNLENELNNPILSDELSDESSDHSSNYSTELSESEDEHIEQTDNLSLEGDIINSYNIIYEIGRGSNSIVWLAYNISNNLFFALKVQNPSEYKEGMQEIKFVQKLPKNPPVFNNLIDYFIEIKNNKKYLCSVWNLHCGDLDTLIRKNNKMKLKVNRNESTKQI